MINKNWRTLAATTVLALCGIGCSMNIDYQPPRDQLGDLCSGNFVNTPSSCAPLGALAPSDMNALILVTEAGNIHASASNLSALRESYPRALYPHFRTLQSNSIAAFLTKLLQENGRRYGRIYLVRSDIESKSLLLDTIQRVTAVHPKVDLLLAIHGVSGGWSLSPDLNVTLSSLEMINFAVGNLSWEQRNRVRAVFSTACYQDASTASLPSMAAAISTAFPSSVNYGSSSINWAPMHRDLTAFEAYYRGASFADAVLGYGNYVLRYNQVTGASRDRLNFPTLLARGCYDNGLWTDCRNRSVSLGGFRMYLYMTEGSVARLSTGPFGDLYGKVANVCDHPDTGAKVPEGTRYSYYLKRTGEFRGDCGTSRRSVTCLASGLWSGVVASPRFSTCKDYSGMIR